MEIRLWIPDVWSGWRYCLRHPRSFLIGAYGFDRWFKTHQDLIKWRGEAERANVRISILNEKLAERGRELSQLKRRAA